MTQKDVDRIYTRQVTRLIGQGFQINTGSMGGPEGEMALVDLYDGHQVIRVMMEGECVYDGMYGNFYTITVGRSTDTRPGHWDDYIRNFNLEVISQIRVAKVANDYFVTPEEWRRISGKRYDRWIQNDDTPESRRLGTGYKSVALRWLQRQPGMDGCQLEDIGKMYSVGGACYEIKVKGKTYRLAARKHD